MGRHIKTISKEEKVPTLRVRQTIHSGNIDCSSHLANNGCVSVFLHGSGHLQSRHQPNKMLHLTPIPATFQHRPMVQIHVLGNAVHSNHVLHSLCSRHHLPMQSGRSRLRQDY